MRLATFTLSLMLFFPDFALASTPDWSSCIEIEEPEHRLACYDKASGLVSESGSQVQNDGENADSNPDGAQWQYSEESSALDDRKDVWLSLLSQNSEGNSIGSPERATLYVRCMQNSTNVFISFNRYTADNQSVRYRLDKGRVQSRRMEVMRGGEGIGLWSGGSAIPFAKSLFGKNTLVVSYTTYTGPVEFSFDVGGLESRINPLAEACNWKP